MRTAQSEHTSPSTLLAAAPAPRAAGSDPLNMGHQDTIRPRGNEPRRLFRWLPLLAVVVGVVAGSWAFGGGPPERLPAISPTSRLAPALDADTVLASASTVDRTSFDEAAYPVPFVIEHGETIGRVLDDLGVPVSDHAAAVAALGDHIDVRRIRPGSAGLAYRDFAQQLARLRMRTPEGWVELEHTDGTWRCRLAPFARRVEVVAVHGQLESSMEQAVRAAGAPIDIAYKMAFVLRWDVDFTRDLRIGDRFDVLYEQVYLDDAPAGPGVVLGLRYENRGRQFEAYRFEDGYYDGQGRPLQKMFLRSPVPFSRVTSRFSRSRFHPVLKVNRPHWGVDYGAPTGTPVKATASGEVTFAGRKGGAGNMIELRHAAGYRTAYLHLSRFAKGVRRGLQVVQGDVIGFVGSTGLATGPHLDYRVKKDGSWIDPLSIQRTPSVPIPADRLAAFEAHRAQVHLALGLEATDAETKLAGGSPRAGEPAAADPAPGGERAAVTMPTTVGNG